MVLITQLSSPSASVDPHRQQSSQSYTQFITHTFIPSIFDPRFATMLERLLTFLLVASVFSSAHAAQNSAQSNATPTTVTSSHASSPPTSNATLLASVILSGSYGVGGQMQFSLEPDLGDVGVKISVTGLMALNSSAQYAYHSFVKFSS